MATDETPLGQLTYKWKKILTEKDVETVIDYDISASDYNPSIDSTITITVTAYNHLNSNIVPNHSFDLKLPDGSTVTLTTNNEGVATYNYTCSSWGVHRFSIKTYRAFINITGWRSQQCTSYGTLHINESLRMCELRYNRNFSAADADKFYSWHTGAIPAEYRPSEQVNGSINQVGVLYVDSAGEIGGKFANSWSSSRLVKGTVIWHY